MVNQTNEPKKLNVSPLFFTFLVKASSFLKLSFIVGSYTALFSATSIFMPLAGAFTGLAGSSLIWCMLAAIKFIFSGTLSAHYLAFYIPGLCASYYFASHSILIRFFVPLACMIGFIAHPAIGAGWVYSLYWLVPMMLYLLGKQSIFLNALGATFTAHAVGSIIWQYTTPMAPEVWLGLIPVVFIERLIFACGMVLAYHVISYGITCWKTISYKKVWSFIFAK